LSLTKSPTTILTRILEILIENSCIMRDVELYNVLHKESNISFSDLIHYLMILEVRGYINVSSSKDRLRIIRLSDYGREQLHVKRC